MSDELPRIVVRGLGGAVDITPLEFFGGPLPSVRADVGAKVEDFSGRCGNVYFDTAMLDAFTASLRRLETSRRGAVLLEAMSPQEFQLTLGVYDELGHLRVSFQVGRLSSTPDGGDPPRLSGSFEFDPEYLAELVGKMESLVAAVARAASA